MHTQALLCTVQINGHPLRAVVDTGATTVSEGVFPYELLGNRFLRHFQMTRNNEQMVLETPF